MRNLFAGSILGAIAATAAANAGVSYSTNFDLMGLGSIDGQDGWDERNASYVATVSDATSASGDRSFLQGAAFGSARMTFSPTLGSSAGESSAIGASLGFDAFNLSLRFRAASLAADGSEVSFGASDASGNRAWSVTLRNEAGGVSVTGYGFDNDGAVFTPSFSVSGLARDEWQHMEILTNFREGEANDTVAYMLNGSTIAVGNTWEQWYRSSTESGTAWNRPYAVNRVAFRATASSAGAQGFHFDDLTYTAVPAPGAVALLAAAGLIASNRRRPA
jgi:hypothetical protein